MNKQVPLTTESVQVSHSSENSTQLILNEKETDPNTEGKSHAEPSTQTAVTMYAGCGTASATPQLHSERNSRSRGRKDGKLTEYRSRQTNTGRKYTRLRQPVNNVKEDAGKIRRRGKTKTQRARTNAVRKRGKSESNE